MAGRVFGVPQDKDYMFPAFPVLALPSHISPIAAGAGVTGKWPGQLTDQGVGLSHGTGHHVLGWVGGISGPCQQPREMLCFLGMKWRDTKLTP